MQPKHSEKALHSAPAGTRRLTVVALLIGCGWSAMALGANGFDINCDGKAKDFLDDAAPADELAISSVDLANGDGMDRLPGDADLDDTPAPMLFLGPRVASILKDVFADDTVRADTATDATAVRKAPMPPLADHSDEAPETDADVAAEAVPAILPRIQREMYRTDI